MMRTTIVQFRFSPWFLSKVIESAVQVQMFAFLDENKVLSVFQSGFRKKHSTETAVVYLVDHILEDMDMQQLPGAAWSSLPPWQARALWNWRMQSYLVQKLSDYSFANLIRLCT